MRTIKSLAIKSLAIKSLPNSTTAKMKLSSFTPALLFTLTMGFPGAEENSVLFGLQPRAKKATCLKFNCTLGPGVWIHSRIVHSANFYFLQSAKCSDTMTLECCGSMVCVDLDNEGEMHCHHCVQRGDSCAGGRVCCEGLGCGDQDQQCA